jgi:2-polyprenyl-3-methyl-5-hydroxy-6-metoxy-1,4-benzoquinol methylase
VARRAEDIPEDILSQIANLYEAGESRNGIARATKLSALEVGAAIGLIERRAKSEANKAEHAKRSDSRAPTEEEKRKVAESIAAARAQDCGFPDGPPETPVDEVFKSKVCRASVKAVKLAEKTLDALQGALEIAIAPAQILDVGRGVKVAAESIHVARQNYYKVRGLDNDDSMAKTAAEHLAKGFAGLIDEIADKYADKRHASDRGVSPDDGQTASSLGIVDQDKADAESRERASKDTEAGE